MRQKWQFEYRANDVALAALRKREYHASRLQWWRDKRAEVARQVEEYATEATRTSSEYGAVKLVGDLAVFGRIIHADAKVGEQERLVAEYSIWVDALKAAPPGSMLAMDHDDYLFFFGD